MNEYTFTFHRPDKKAERTEVIEATDFDDAAKQATEFCQRHRCKVARIEWSEDGRRQRSDVQYT